MRGGGRRREATEEEEEEKEKEKAAGAELKTKTPHNDVGNKHHQDHRMDELQKGL